MSMNTTTDSVLQAIFGLGPLELGIILVIVILIFGVGKLPQVGEGFGKMISGFKKAQREGERELADAKQTLTAPAREIHTTAREIRQEVVEVSPEHEDQGA